MYLSRRTLVTLVSEGALICLPLVEAYVILDSYCVSSHGTGHAHSSLCGRNLSEDVMDKY